MICVRDNCKHYILKFFTNLSCVLYLSILCDKTVLMTTLILIQVLFYVLFLFLYVYTVSGRKKFFDNELVLLGTLITI